MARELQKSGPGGSWGEHGPVVLAVQQQVGTNDIIVPPASKYLSWA